MINWDDIVENTDGSPIGMLAQISGIAEEISFITISLVKHDGTFIHAVGNTHPKDCTSTFTAIGVLEMTIEAVKDTMYQAAEDK